MRPMLRHSLLRICVLVAGFGLIASTLAGAQTGAQDDGWQHGRKYKAPPPAARIVIAVVKAINGKPVENAAVIFHPIEGDRDKGGLEVKTNEEGKAIIDVIPVGDTVRLQVIARGYQTYGYDFKVDKPEITLHVRLNRPGEQYSIYPDKGAGTPPGSAPAQPKAK